MKKFLLILLILLLIPCQATANGINAVYASFNVYFNGQALDNVIVVNDEAYVPLKKALEMTGYTAQWDGKNVQVTQVTSIDKLKESCVRVFSYNGNTLVENGSGVVTEYGIITAYHVVDVGKDIYVEYNSSDTKNKVSVISTYKDLDIAILENPNIDIPFAEFGDDTTLKKGDIVYDIGSTSKLKNSITKGKFVKYDTMDGRNIISTSVKAVAGYSGSPFFDSGGKLVGFCQALNGGKTESGGTTINALIEKLK